jgi:hypothetical protein
MTALSLSAYSLLARFLRNRENNPLKGDKKKERGAFIWRQMRLDQWQKNYDETDLSKHLTNTILETYPQR